MLSRTRIITSFLLILAFVWAYVPCSDGSACEDNYKCCNKGLGYSCCPDLQNCCNNGYTCCELKRSNTTFISYVKSKAPRSSLKAYLDIINILFDESFVPNKVLEYPSKRHYTLNITKITEDVELTLSSFINTIDIDFNFDYIINCETEIKTVLKDINKAINIFNSHFNTTSEIEYLIRIAEIFAEIFYHTSAMITNCQNAEKDFCLLYNKTMNYTSQEAYWSKVNKNIQRDFIKILHLLNEAVIMLKEENFSKLGEIIGKMFNLIFIIKKNNLYVKLILIL